MIRIGDTVFHLEDPATLAIGAGALVVVVILLLLLAASRSAARAARMVGQVGQRMQTLAEGQERLAGGLHHVSEAQAQAQVSVLQVMEQRMAEVQASMTDSLHGASRRTAQSLGALQERLKVIDAAQDKITRLSGDVLSLQDILSNKQTRGAFGEIQLTEIVMQALPPDSYSLQATLSNGRRADCLIHLPHPPGPIVIDSKFPLEAYEALRAARSPEQTSRAAQAFRLSVRKHIRDIAERYIIDGETAEGALMFLPSEAVYAELHANFGDIVREGFAARVWIVSPTTCMATLNTTRAVLKDVRMQQQAGAIRRELALLYADVERLGARVDNLDRHFGQAAKDLSEIRISAEKAGARARRLDDFDFEDLSGNDAGSVIKMTSPGG